MQAGAHSFSIPSSASMAPSVLPALIERLRSAARSRTASTLSGAGSYSGNTILQNQDRKWQKERSESYKMP